MGKKQELLIIWNSSFETFPRFVSIYFGEIKWESSSFQIKNWSKITLQNVVLEKATEILVVESMEVLGNTDSVDFCFLVSGFSKFSLGQWIKHYFENNFKRVIHFESYEQSVAVSFFS